MIYYFSGTGNSEWVADTLAEQTGDTALSIIGKDTKIKVGAGETFGIVFPVYAWGTPHIVLDFLKNVITETESFCFAVCTCGGEAGNTIDKLKKVFPLKSGYSVLMPNNYIVMGSKVDSEETQKEKVENARVKIAEIAANVRKQKCVFDVDKGSFAFVKSGIVNKMFNKYSMNASPFLATDKCVSCSQCAKNCPVGNIRMTNGKPKWENRCIQCLSCINRCPEEAIQYGEKTVLTGRYYFHFD